MTDTIEIETLNYFEGGDSNITLSQDFARISFHSHLFNFNNSIFQFIFGSTGKEDAEIYRMYRDCNVLNHCSHSIFFGVYTIRKSWFIE